MKQQYGQRRCNLSYEAWHGNINAVAAPGSATHEHQIALGISAIARRCKLLTLHHKSPGNMGIVQRLVSQTGED